MIIIAGGLLGAAIGAINARRRGGNGFDITQYTGVGLIIGGIVGMFATVAVERLL